MGDAVTTHTQENEERRDGGEDDDTLIIFDEQDVAQGVEVCERSLISRVVTEKSINKASFQNAMTNMWGVKEGLKIVEIQEKLFQLFFEEERAMVGVQKGSPWLYRNAWVLMKRWEREVEPHQMNFDEVDIWIQIWGLSTHCRTPLMGRKIGLCLGVVKEVAVYDMGVGNGTVLKVLVRVNINKPLRKGVNAGSKKDGVSWVDFRYEQLPQFCYQCGIVGHGESFCRTKEEGASQNQDLPFRPCLQGQLGGRKVAFGDRKDDPMTARRKQQTTKQGE